MTSLIYGAVSASGVPADEKTVRSTTAPVDVTAPPAAQDHTPERGLIETDTNPQLGMVNRQLASPWTEGVRDVPAWIPEVDAGTDHNAIVNRQVSSSGTAAQREASGVTNKNLSYAIGIEPVADRVSNGSFGEQYFVRNERNIQATMNNEMSVPPGYDVANRGEITALGKTDARNASMAGIYDTFWNGGH